MNDREKLRSLLRCWSSTVTARVPSHAEYARSLELPDGERKGLLYDPSMHPAQECIIRALDAGTTHVTIMKPVQDGGTLVSLVPVLLRGLKRAQSVLIAYPTMDSAKDAWTTKVGPLLEAQGVEMPKKGGGSRGGAARVLMLPGGGKFMLRAAGGRGESGQASVTADALLVDEVDDWEDLRRIRLIERRLAKSPDPLMVFVSTIKRDESDGDEKSRILTMYESGTQTRLRYSCPHCGEKFTPEHKHIDANECCLVCPSCTCLITEKQRQEMLRTWERVDGNGLAKRFSITWTALESPFPLTINGKKAPVLNSLCDEFAEATKSAEAGNHGMLRQYHRDRMCCPYQDSDGEVPKTTELALATRVATNGFRRGEIPPAAQYVGVGADVGKREAWWAAVAIDADNRWWVVDWGRSEITRGGSADKVEEPSPSERSAMLDALKERTLKLSRANVCCVDCGYTPEVVVPWARRNGWRLVRGDMRPEGSDAAAFGQWGESRKQKAGHIITFIRTAEVKKLLHAGFAIDPEKPGAGMIPMGEAANDWIIRHLCSEIWSNKSGWVKIRPQNHLLDCVVYALAHCLARKKAANRAPRKYGVTGSDENHTQTDRPRRKYGVTGSYL